ncbi:MAG TPA: hypothetical protein PK788_08845, partial [Gemmatimonadaceae bacterium]|nr:hypothetical protein [Gemmatimonadaceae bacterium]
MNERPPRRSVGPLQGAALLWLGLLVGFAGIVTLGQGAFYAVGAYLALGLYLSIGLAPWWSLAVAAVLFFGIGYLIQRFLINRVI